MHQLPKKGRQSLQAWIAEQMADDEEERGGKLARFSLVHLQGTHAGEVQSVRMRAGAEQTPAYLAKFFQDRADNYAQDLVGVQTFNLLAFWGESQEPGNRRIILIESKPEAFNGLSTEPPTTQGLVQQSMRQQEMLFNQTYGKQTHLDMMMTQQAIRAEKRNEELEAKNIQLMQMFFEFMKEKATDMHARNMEVLAYQRQTEERAKLFAVAPGLINQVFGRDILPTNTIDTEILRQIALKLKPEHLQMLQGLGILGDEQMGMLMHRFNQFMDEEAQKQRIVAAQNPHYRTTNPEAEAAGETDEPEHLAALETNGARASHGH